MSYEAIDAPLARWAADHRLHVGTKYRDEEVRSIDIVSQKGRRYQLWIDPPRDGGIAIHAWDYKKRRADFDVLVNDLPLALDEALVEIGKWMQAE
jgi:hypothetical protein